MRLKDIVEKTFAWLISVWIYLPILFGILMPMFIYFPIAYSSWHILTLIIGATSFYNYLNSWFVIYPSNTNLISILVIIEVCIFILGFAIFLSGLLTILKCRLNGIKIAQSGLYKYIRHPQNLGILIFTLPFILYIPGFGDLGIRIMDFLSWIFFGMITMIICDLEEYRMEKLFGTDYEEYRNKTGYFFPKIRNKRLNLIMDKKIFYLIRYFALIFFLILIVNITNRIAEFLLLNDLLVIFR